MPSVQPIPEPETGLTVVVQLPKDGLVVDSRFMMDGVWPLGLRDNIETAFECTVQGRTLTVTKRSDYIYPIPVSTVYFRVYDPDEETVPDFNSNFYRYYGMDHEKAPIRVEKVVVDDSVDVIQEYAFAGCRHMQNCTMHDRVWLIKRGAFEDCIEMRHIKLSMSLQILEADVFNNCSSIESLWFPPSVRSLGNHCMECCSAMKLLNVTPPMEIGKRVVAYCTEILTRTHYHYVDSSGSMTWNGLNNRMNRRLFSYNRNHKLLKILANPNVNSDAVDNYISENGTIEFFYGNRHHEITPLHVVTKFNPFVRDDVILACFDANPSALVYKDMDGIKPLDCLWLRSDRNMFNVISQMMIDLCGKWKRKNKKLKIENHSMNPRGEYETWRRREDGTWKVDTWDWDPYDSRTWNKPTTLGVATFEY